MFDPGDEIYYFKFRMLWLCPADKLSKLLGRIGGHGKSVEN
jgi:hypothetical protein